MISSRVKLTSNKAILSVSLKKNAVCGEEAIEFRSLENGAPHPAPPLHQHLASSPSHPLPHSEALCVSESVHNQVTSPGAGEVDGKHGEGSGREEAG